MIRITLSSAFSIYFLLLFTSGLSQYSDLIVTTKGDSIACRIDSINDLRIYYEMKSRNTWIQTHINITDVSDYKQNAIDKKQFVFETGTSIIKSLKPALPGSISEIQRNSIYVGILSLNYSRMIPVKRVGINLAGGFSFFGVLLDDGIDLMGEISLLTCGVKHYFEPGFLILYGFDITFAMLRMGYRYQGPDGFLFRAGFLLSYVDGISGLPALSIGYSF